MTSDATSATTRFEARHAAHAELHSITTTLIAEFSDRVPAGTVIRVVAQAREQLLLVGLRAGLPHAAESMARAQLSARRLAMGGTS